MARLGEADSGPHRRLSLALACASVFGLAAAASLVAIAFEVYRTEQVALRDDARAAVLTQRLRFRLERQVAYERAFLLTREPGFRRHLVMDPLIEILEKDLAARLASPEDRALLGSIRSNVAAYRRDLLAMRGSARSRQGDLGYFERVLRPQREVLAAQLDRLTDVENQRLSDAARAASEAGRRILAWGGALTALLIAALLAVRAFSRRTLAEIARGEQYLLAAKNDLESLLRARTRRLVTVMEQMEDFGHSVAHDLRRPARSVTAFSELALAKASALDEESRGHLRRVLGAGRRLRAMLDGLLALNRLSKFPPAIRRIDLAAIARAVAADLAAAEPGRRVAFSVAPALEAEADPDLVRVLLRNLLDNAWKFTRGREGASVEVGVDRDGPTPVFFVRDNGVGFEPSLGARIFQPFLRLPNADKLPGIGIGLAAAARVVALHGGRIWAEGQRDVGAKFRFTLSEEP